jgi:hypothetical protein
MAGITRGSCHEVSIHQQDGWAMSFIPMESGSGVVIAPLQRSVRRFCERRDTGTDQ